MHEQYASYMETTLQLAANQGVVLPPRSSAAKSALAGIKASLTLYLPDDDVGAILGRGGQNLVDIQQVREGGAILGCGGQNLVRCGGGRHPGSGEGGGREGMHPTSGVEGGTAGLHPGSGEGGASVWGLPLGLLGSWILQPPWILDSFAFRVRVTPSCYKFTG